MLKQFTSQLIKRVSNNNSSSKILIKNINNFTKLSLKTDSFNFSLLLNNKFNINTSKYFYSSSQLPKKSVKQLLHELQQIKKQHGQNSMQMMDILHRLSFTYAQQGKIQQSIKTYENLVKTFKTNIDDTKSPAVGDTLKNLQTLYKRSGKLMQLIPLTLQLIQIRQKQHGPNHKILSNQYHQLGVAYYYIGNYSQSLQNYKRALSIRQKQCGKQSTEYIETENNIGTIYFQEKQINQAKRIFLANIDKIKKFKQLKNTMLITPLANLAMIYEQQNKLQQCIKLYEQIQSIFIQNNQSNSVYIANIYHSMGIIHLKMSNITKSLQSHKKSLQINQSKHSKPHPSIAGNYHNIGLCLEYMNKFQQSIQHYNKSIQIKKKIFGQKHQTIAESLSNIAMIKKGLRKYDQARKHFQECEEIIRLATKDDMHPAIGDISLNVAIIYMEEHRLDKAKQYIKKTQSILLPLFDKNHPKIAQLYFNKAKLSFSLQRNYTSARQSLQKAIKIYQNSMPTHSSLYIMYSMKASCYFEQKQFKDAIDNYQKALNILTSQNTKGTSEQISINKALLQYQMGATYCELKDFANAEKILIKALEVFQTKFSQAYDTLVQIYFLLANSQRELTKINSSKQNFKKAQNCVEFLLKQAPGHPILLKKQQEINRCMNL